MLCVHLVLSDSGSIDIIGQRSTIAVGGKLVIVINGPSYRDWEHQQDVGTVRTATAAMTEPRPPEVAPRPASAGARRREK
jgi:hypothetical protein